MTLKAALLQVSVVCKEYKELLKGVRAPLSLLQIGNVGM